jgi:hypothetical protein
VRRPLGGIAHAEAKPIGTFIADGKLNDSGSRLSIAARQRAFVHMPWAIAEGNPNRRALSECRWMGFMSPDTEP